MTATSELAPSAAPVAPAPAPALERLELGDPRWAAFATAHPDATPFHHPAWAGLLGRTYGFPAFALALVDGGRVVAGAPFLETRTPARRRRWISLPFTDEVAPLGAPALRAPFLEALGCSAEHPVQLRCPAEAPGWSNRQEAVIHVLDLDADAETVRRGFSRSQVVRNIKRAEREGVEVRPARTRADLDAFYALHARTRQRQGVPVQPRRFFDAIWTDMVEQGLATILLASAGGPPLATALFLHAGATTVYKFGASDPDGWPVRPNHLIFWTAIQDACARGHRRFDFGRTDLDNPGLRAFKSGWGATERPLVYAAVAPGAASGEPSLAGRAMATAIQRGPAWLGRGLGAALYRYAASR
ncbi:MAG TPA: GNAT family N-acetyltransferase [Baekduia sp.]|nr:GNAT family N-acetyltransferase [Baekduia sp.]